MRVSLRGYTTAVVGEMAREPIGQQVADDLTAIAHLVSRTSSLAVVMTDFTVPVPARRRVLRDLLEGRVHPIALRLALRAVEIERADELPTSLHELYELAIHMHVMGEQELLAQEPISTRRLWRELASGYATAIFEDSTPEDLEEIEDELFRFARIVEANPSLRSALADPSRSTESRRRLLDEILDGKVKPATMRVAKITLEGHVRDVVGALDFLSELAASARGWRVARVHTARAIDEDERRSLSEAMERITGHPVELHILEDPELLGGAVIQVGDLLVDASARHRLDTLKDRLLGSEGARTGAAQ